MKHWWLYSRKFWLLLLLALLVLPWPEMPTTPRAEAFEPVTMMILAPVAVKVYEKAEPRLARGARACGKRIISMGKHTLEILYLPLGVVQSTAGIPFGGLGSGIKNIGKGLIAPGKLVIDVLLLPFSMFGADFNF